MTPDEEVITPVEGEETTAENTDAVIATDTAAELSEPGLASAEENSEETVAPEALETLNKDLDEAIEEPVDPLMIDPDTGKKFAEPEAEVIPEPVNKIDLHYKPIIPVKEETNQRIQTARRGEDRISRDKVGKE